MASILAISASQSGPAHSFIVGEALKSAAARAGHKLGLKVISHLGEQGSFSDDDLAKADVAVVVADGPVDLSDLPKTLRIFETTPQAVFDDADGVVAQAVAGSGVPVVGVGLIEEAAQAEQALRNEDTAEE